MIAFEEWRSVSRYRLVLDESLDVFLEGMDDEEETGFLKGLRTWATSLLNKVQSSIAKVPDDKTLDREVPRLMDQLREKFGKYSKENFDPELIANFNFFDHVKSFHESFGVVGRAIYKGIVMILKWLFISLADLINAGLNMIKHSLTGEGFFKICVFWVAPAILASPVMGLQALYGISNLIGLTPFIGWVVWNVFVKPAIYKLSGAKRVPIGLSDPDDPDSGTVIGGWRPKMA